MHILNLFVNIIIGDDMKKILITGARSGMIFPVIQELKKNNYLYVTVHTPSELKYIKKLYRNDENVECLKLDVTEDIDLIDDLDIDILVCNGAIAESGSLFEMPISKLKQNFDVNVFANVALVQKVSKKMLEKGYGRIVIISSLTSKMPLPFLGSYSSSKAALSVCGLCLHYESLLLPKRIDVVLVEPGLYRTGFNKLAFDKKYEFMDNKSFFDKHTQLIRKSENIYLWLFEKRRLNSIKNKICEAITADKPHFRYSAPFSHNLIAKIFNLLH